MEGVDVDRITRPFEALRPGVHNQPGELVDRPARAVLARQPFGIKQRQRPRSDNGDRLVDDEDTPLEVGCIDVEADRSGIRPVDGDGDRIDERDGLRLR